MSGRSERCESAIPASLRFQLWIIVDAGLGPDFTTSVCELMVEDCSFADSKEPGKVGNVGGDPPAEGDAGLVDDLGFDDGNSLRMSGEGLEISVVFSEEVLAAFSAACLSTFCCLRIRSTGRLSKRYAIQSNRRPTHRCIRVASKPSDQLKGWS
jgi:hypothetical protein